MRADGLHRIAVLTADDYAAIDQLATDCNALDGGQLRLNRELLLMRPTDSTRDWLWYADGTLLGCLLVFAFGPDEAELVGMVQSAHRRRGIFTQLYEAAHADCAARGFGQLLLMVERDQEAGHGFITHIGATFAHAEYAMELVTPPPTTLRHADLTLRAATPADAPAMTPILAAAFAEDEEDPADFARSMERNPHRRWLVALAGTTPIATMGLVGDTTETAIYGFAVQPAWQGRGFGRQILAQTVTRLLAEGTQHIILEVATENARALGLYLASGFRQVTAYEYYAVSLAGSPK
ncbi:MAG: GNAT family N-acetyltransferase [Ktedonobacterales bacterium]|nr:GNAT family N-acetyltransferase [Ktedonobacterales bacterium]